VVTVVDLNQFSAQIIRLEKSNRALANQALSLSPRHPHHHAVHVLYGGAQLFSEATFPKISRLANEAFHFAAPDAASLSALVGRNWSKEFSGDIFARVSAKLAREPLEDYRIDFEDGYGVRPDEEESRHAIEVATTVVKLAKSQAAPRSIGIRVKPLSTAAMRRSLTTLSVFMSQFAAVGGRGCGLKFLIITLPKVTSAEQVTTMVDILEAYEQEFGFSSGFFRLEILIESPEAFLSIDGTIPIPSFIAAARGRCQSIHFGIYDFTSSLGIGSAGQSIDHLACDFARMWMQVAAGLAPGLGLSDGIISRLPLPPKEKTTSSLADFQEAWRYNYTQMTRSLTLGYYQGWDLHPAQIPVRHVANHVFVLQEFAGAAARLKTFLHKASQASHVAGVFDDRASVLGLLNFFERAMVAGILTTSEISAAGVDLEAVKRSI
jgi:citrate lyase beta subunit